MLCELGDEARYVRSGDKCLLCDSEQESTMMLIIAIFGVLLCGVVGYILHRAAKSFEQVGWRFRLDGLESAAKPQLRLFFFAVATGRRSVKARDKAHFCWVAHI